MTKELTMFRASLFFLAACLFAVHTVEAKELRDESFGFRCMVPDDFEAVHLQSPGPDNVFSLADQQSGQTTSPLIIQITHLGMTVGPEEYHMAASDLPPREATTFTNEDFQWKGLTLSVFLKEISPSSGHRMLDYFVVYPLDKEAVKLEVYGWEDRSAEIKRLFFQVAASFENLRPLYGSTHTMTVLSGPKKVRMTLYDMIRDGVSKVPVVMWVGATALVVMVVACLVMLIRR